MRSFKDTWLTVGTLLMLTILIALTLFFGIAQLRLSESGLVDAARGLISTFETQEEPEVNAPFPVEEWANKLAEGGFILHFRHTEREAWDDVTGFDAIESSQSLDGETESWSSAVCLTDKGKEQAKFIGKVMEYANIQIGPAFASPSCRARQTCRLATGEDCREIPSLLHRSAMPGFQHEAAAKRLRDQILSISIPQGSNALLVGHNSTLNFDAERGTIIEDVTSQKEQGGFSILEREDGKIFVRHTFDTFADFVNSFTIVPLE